MDLLQWARVGYLAIVLQIPRENPLLEHGFLDPLGARLLHAVMVEQHC